MARTVPMTQKPALIWAKGPRHTVDSSKRSQLQGMRIKYREDGAVQEATFLKKAWASQCSILAAFSNGPTSSIWYITWNTKQSISRVRHHSGKSLSTSKMVQFHNLMDVEILDDSNLGFSVALFPDTSNQMAPKKSFPVVPVCPNYAEGRATNNGKSNSALHKDLGHEARACWSSLAVLAKLYTWVAAVAERGFSDSIPEEGAFFQLTTMCHGTSCGPTWEMF